MLAQPWLRSRICAEADLRVALLGFEGTLKSPSGHILELIQYRAPMYPPHPAGTAYPNSAHLAFVGGGRPARVPAVTRRRCSIPVGARRDHVGNQSWGLHSVLPRSGFCENNQYAVSVPFHQASATRTVAEMGRGPCNTGHACGRHGWAQGFRGRRRTGPARRRAYADRMLHLPFCWTLSARSG